MADDAGRETYPSAPSKGGSANAPMTDDDQEIDSSTIYEQDPVDSETATPQEAIEGEDAQDENVPFNQHPRWKEREEEWKYKLEKLERESEQSRQLAQAAIERFQGPQAPPKADPWEGLTNHPDPATAQWYQQQRLITESTAERIAETKLASVMQAVDAGRQELAVMKINQFRKDNPDIGMGTPEEAAVIAGLQQGLSLDTARKLALFDKYERENSELKGKRSAAPRKIAANNTERTSGIPEKSGLPHRQGDWRAKASEVYDKGGSAVDVFNSVFRGGKR